MYNFQSHYFLSKRTRIYGQITLTQAADTANNGGSTVYNSRSFSPAHGTNSVSGINTNFGALGTAGGGGNTTANANGYSVGVIHSF
jgi:hypothetical protein